STPARDIEKSISVAEHSRELLIELYTPADHTSPNTADTSTIVITPKELTDQELIRKQWKKDFLYYPFIGSIITAVIAVIPSISIAIVNKKLTVPALFATYTLGLVFLPHLIWGLGIGLVIGFLYACTWQINPKMEPLPNGAVKQTNLIFGTERIIFQEPTREEIAELKKNLHGRISDDLDQHNQSLVNQYTNVISSLLRSSKGMDYDKLMKAAGIKRAGDLSINRWEEISHEMRFTIAQNEHQQTISSLNEKYHFSKIIPYFKKMKKESPVYLIAYFLLFPIMFGYKLLHMFALQFAQTPVSFFWMKRYNNAWITADQAVPYISALAKKYNESPFNALILSLRKNQQIKYHDLSTLDHTYTEFVQAQKQPFHKAGLINQENIQHNMFRYWITSRIISWIAGIFAKSSDDAAVKHAIDTRKKYLEAINNIEKSLDPAENKNEIAVVSQLRDLAQSEIINKEVTKQRRRDSIVLGRLSRGSKKYLYHYTLISGFVKFLKRRGSISIWSISASTIIIPLIFGTAIGLPAAGLIISGITYSAYRKENSPGTTIINGKKTVFTIISTWAVIAVLIFIGASFPVFSELLQSHLGTGVLGFILTFQKAITQKKDSLLTDTTFTDTLQHLSKYKEGGKNLNNLTELLSKEAKLRSNHYLDLNQFIASLSTHANLSLLEKAVVLALIRRNIAFGYMHLKGIQRDALLAIITFTEHTLGIDTITLIDAEGIIAEKLLIHRSSREIIKDVYAIAWRETLFSRAYWWQWLSTTIGLSVVGFEIAGVTWGAGKIDQAFGTNIIAPFVYLIEGMQDKDYQPETTLQTYHAHGALGLFNNMLESAANVAAHIFGYDGHFSLQGWLQDAAVKQKISKLDAKIKSLEASNQTDSELYVKWKFLQQTYKTRIDAKNNARQIELKTLQGASQEELAEVTLKLRIARYQHGVLAAAPNNHESRVSALNKLPYIEEAFVQKAKEEGRPRTYASSHGITVMGGTSLPGIAITIMSALFGAFDQHAEAEVEPDPVKIEQKINAEKESAEKIKEEQHKTTEELAELQKKQNELYKSQEIDIEYITPDLQDQNIKAYSKYYSDKALKSGSFNGLVRSYYGDDSTNFTRYAAVTYDQALLAIQNPEQGKDITDTYFTNKELRETRGNLDPGNGLFNNIRLEGRNIPNWWDDNWDWSSHNGPQAWMGLAAETRDNIRLSDRIAGYLHQFERDIGGFIMGPKGQFVDVSYVVSTENEESMLAFFESRYARTHDPHDIQAADSAYRSIKSRYDKDVHLLRTGEHLERNQWVRDSHEDHASDTANWFISSALHRIILDPFFGGTVEDRLDEMNRMLTASAKLTGLFDDEGRLMGIDYFARPGEKIISLEWSSQRAVAYLRLAQEYANIGIFNKAQEHLDSYRHLINSLKMFYTDTNGVLTAPYAVYKNGTAVDGLYTARQYGWEISDAPQAAASSYFAFAKAGYDPLISDGGPGIPVIPENWEELKTKELTSDEQKELNQLQTQIQQKQRELDELNAHLRESEEKIDDYTEKIAEKRDEKHSEKISRDMPEKYSNAQIKLLKQRLSDIKTKLSKIEAIEDKEELFKEYAAIVSELREHYDRPTNLESSREADDDFQYSRIFPVPAASPVP
ncbi:MAG: hypothetical protein ABII23_07750, partial [bacterium]